METLQTLSKLKTTLKNKQNRVQQICESFKIGNPLIFMADGGGPFFKVKPGLIKTATAANAKLMPVAFHLKNGLELGKRRRHRWPLPFSTIDCSIGQPVSIDPEQEELSRLESERMLELLELKANSRRSVI